MSEMTKTAQGEHELTAKEREKVVESLVIRGDWSGLGAAERVRAYNALCAGYGLNPLSRPFEFLKLQGKDVLYARREATDQLAAMHRVNRKIVDGPKLIDLAGTKLIYCVVEASLPNGRVENSTATLPLTDPANVLMKCETKGKRRATLAILGMGMLTEEEVDSIPGAVRVEFQALPESAGNPAVDAAAESLVDVADLAGLRAWYVALDLRSDDTDASEHVSGLAADRLTALGYRLSSVEHHAALGGTLSDELRHVHDVLSAERELGSLVAQCRALRVNATDDAKRAMARYYGALHTPPITDPRKAGRALADALDPKPDGTDGAGSPAKATTSKANGRGESTTAASGPTGCVETWMTTMLGIDTYLGQKTLWTLLENAVRKHARAVPEGTLRMYFLRRAIERLQMLSKDALGTVLALDGKGGCRELVMCWADEGPRKEAAQRKAMETLTTAAQLDRQVA